MNKKVLVKFLDDTGTCNPTLPTFGSEKAAGLDLYSTHEVALEAGMPQIVHTGIAMELVAEKKASTSRDQYGRFCTIMVEDNLMLQIVPRSGLALNDGVTVLNAPGIIDEDYRGEVCVILCWTGAETSLNQFNIKTVKGKKYLVIPEKTRIAQAVLVPVYKPVLEVVETLTETKRGTEGFGSTGVSDIKADEVGTAKNTVAATTKKTKKETAKAPKIKKATKKVKE